MLRIRETIALVAFAAFFFGCEPPPAPPVPPASNTANTNVSTAPPANAQPPATAATRNAGLPVTMPLIDAMFADEEFAADAKSALQLNDDEIAKLRDAATNAVLQLGSDEDGNRSTRASTEKTRREIEKILGPERSEQFINFVRDRWSGDAEELTAIKPNEVPTDTRIVVNAPAYRMDIFKDGELVKTYKVGIGYPEFPLPVGLRKANTIIFNPPWTPPDEPWVKGKFRPGQKVAPGSKLNPLGPIKIPIGLPSLIHGGKDPSRLGTFASHGCVGLTSPGIKDFANEIASLSGTRLSREDIDAYEKQKTETEELKLAQPVRVELRYETIVVEDGKVHIYRDVYEKGTNTEENLRKVLDVYGVSLDSVSENERAALLDALKQMAVDATGNQVTEEEANSSKPKKSTSGKVTRNIKGKKEIVVEVAALRGKGYPAPVNLVGK